MRGDKVESIHRGTFAVAAADGELILEAGDTSQGTFMRSSAKPFQAMALILTGTADSLGLADEDLAIACSSHSGEPDHVDAVAQLLSKGDAPTDALRCGAHAPLSSDASRDLISSQRHPTVLHNNCSGKHAGMLVTAAARGWPLDSYLDPNHPLQRLNLQTVSEFTGLPEAEIGVAIDGCGVPAFYVPIQSIAIAFARLAQGSHVTERYEEAARRIRQAMTAHPHLVGGRSRFDTELMESAKGAIVSKGGAQGCEGIGLISQGLGVGLKISDGSSSPIPLVCIEILCGLGVLDGTVERDLRHVDRTTIRNHAGTVTGAMATTFTVSGSNL